MRSFVMTTTFPTPSTQKVRRHVLRGQARRRPPARRSPRAFFCAKKIIRVLRQGHHHPDEALECFVEVTPHPRPSTRVLRRGHPPPPTEHSSASLRSAARADQALECPVLVHPHPRPSTRVLRSGHAPPRSKHSSARGALFLRQDVRHRRVEHPVEHVDRTFCVGHGHEARRRRGRRRAGHRWPRRLGAGLHDSTDVGPR